MKISHLLILALSLSLTISTSVQKEAISLSFFVEHEVELDQDYLEMVVGIKAQDTSLKTALEGAAATVAFVRNEVEKFCLTHSKKKAECEEISECGKFNVQPQYRTIRGEPVFIAFAVRYEVTAKILQTQQDIGPLVDKIGKRSGSQIMAIEWKDAQEEDEEMIAIDMGLEEAKARCKNVGGVLGEIQGVSEVPRFDIEEKPAEGEEEQEEEEEQTEIIKYKFDIRCLLKEKSEKSDKNQKKKEKKQKKK